jgi:hypothetical protein
VVLVAFALCTPTSFWLAAAHRSPHIVLVQPLGLSHEHGIRALHAGALIGNARNVTCQCDGCVGPLRLLHATKLWYGMEGIFSHEHCEEYVSITVGPCVIV